MSTKNYITNTISCLYYQSILMYYFFFKCWEKLSCQAKKINWHWLSQGLAIKIDFKILEFKVTLGIQSRPALVYLEEGGIQEGGGGVRSYKLPLFKDETMDNNQQIWKWFVLCLCLFFLFMAQGGSCRSSSSSEACGGRRSTIDK